MQTLNESLREIVQLEKKAVEIFELAEKRLILKGREDGFDESALLRIRSIANQIIGILEEIYHEKLVTDEVMITRFIAYLRNCGDYIANGDEISMIFI